MIEKRKKMTIPFLKCLICEESKLQLLENNLSMFKKIKCLSCGFSNERKEVEIEVLMERKEK